MKTITTIATIGNDRVLTVLLPADVVPGEHEIVIVVNGVNTKPPRQTTLSPPDLLSESNSSIRFGREEIYGDDGR